MYSSVLAALVHRGTSGEGTEIEVSLFDALIEWMGHPINYGLYTGRVRFEQATLTHRLSVWVIRCVGRAGAVRHSESTRVGVVLCRRVAATRGDDR